MICSVCYRMLRGQDGRQWRGTFDIRFAHHSSKSSLALSAETGCCFCRVLAEELTHLAPSDRHPRDSVHFITAFLGDVKERSAGRSKYDFGYKSTSADDHIRRLTSVQINDSSAALADFLRLYRLEFKLNDSRRLGTFLLKPSDHALHGRTYSISSNSTEANEVLDLARYWIKRCNGQEHPRCRDWERAGVRDWDPDDDCSQNHSVGGKDGKKDREGRDFIPTRLIELPRTRNKAGPLGGQEDDPLKKIKLIETAELDAKARARVVYVTLSHRWGDALFTRLLKRNHKDFLRDIPFEPLPQTFRDAIDFAKRLDRDRIRYIWIDSLCIIQDDSDDWLRESVKMYQIYANSYCNISATAAVDGSKGLFFPRDPYILLEDEINLNTNGLLRQSRTEKQSKLPSGYRPIIRRCEVYDVGFWNRLVEDSPVNRRGWVLQERLLAPRVLHFCEDQIAWECSEHEAAESFSDGLPTQEIVSGALQEKVRLKTLLAWQHSSDQRRQMIIDPDQTSEAVQNHWNLVVERYSSTGLTHGSDRLIALAGIAQLMKDRIRGDYVAGMWEKYLASQLLWRVRTAYEFGRLLYPSRRPAEYRAPSFSWASVDTPQGIHCATIRRERELLIAVKKIHVTTQDVDGKKNAYGPLKTLGTSTEPADKAEVCHIDLECTRVRVSVELYDYRGNPRYHVGFYGNVTRYSEMDSSTGEPPNDGRKQFVGESSKHPEHNEEQHNLLPAKDENSNEDPNGLHAEPEQIHAKRHAAASLNSAPAQAEAGAEQYHEEKISIERSVASERSVHFPEHIKRSTTDLIANTLTTHPTTQDEDARALKHKKFRAQKAKEAKPTIGVYLDCPDRDGPDIEDKKAVVYCVPASQSMDEGLICLLLYKEHRREGQMIDLYRRIGLVTIPTFLPADQEEFIARASGETVVMRII